MRSWLLLIVLALPSAAWAADGAAPRPDEFFERHVRPVLVTHCQPCHGPKKQEAGLRLDSAASLQTGGDGGPVVVAGDPENSLLIEVIRYDGPTKMPPKAKLPEEAVAALTDWVRHGAIWPEDKTASADVKASPRELARTHWAFQPVREPHVPRVPDDTRWISSPVDAFVLARLQEAGLSPNPRADRKTLIRRVTFDLHGLPPSPEEVSAFEADPADDAAAFETVVNRLLASPRYGERWGRHWLDVARYADTKGYVRLKDNPSYVCSWTYRDYVIRAFNDDLPYDRFILEQLAADQLDLGEDPGALAAMGFLTLGQRFINSQHDIIDDRIDVVTRGLLGLTVACARCHDHKFEPIPTRDYYALHGVFASSAEPRVPRLILSPDQRPRYESYLTELQKRTGELDEFLRSQHAAMSVSFRERAGEYLLAAHKEPVQANFVATMFLVDVTKDLNPVMTQRWGRFLEQTKGKPHPVLSIWHELASLPAEGFSARAAERIAQWKENRPGDARAASTDVPANLNSLVLQALEKEPPRDLAEVAGRFGKLFQEADRRWQTLLQEDPQATRLPDDNWEELRQLLYGPDAPAAVALAEFEDFLFVDATLENQWHDKQRVVEDWIASPGAAPHALTLVDVSVPVEPRVFRRGNPSNPGDAVPRQFLEVLSPSELQPFRHGSGRLELARAIADRQNPLTARVLVNRVWLHHFGTGLVRTPGDFGIRGERPTHPELLDYLAWRFMEEGWSIKSLHRLILGSATYQQASADRPEGLQKDPENTLFWKMNRRRLDWEGLRDSLLSVAGNLDLTMGGPSVNLTTPLSMRRTIYGLVDRQQLAAEFRTFDFAPPDVSSPQRNQTTVPQQALFLMNSPLLKTQVRELARREEFATQSNVKERIAALYRRLYGRDPEPMETSAGLAFLDAGPSGAVESGDGLLTRWEEYVQVLLLANEFTFVD